MTFDLLRALVGELLRIGVAIDAVLQWFAETFGVYAAQFTTPRGAG